MTGRDRIRTVALLGLGFAAAAASSAVSLVQAATMPWGVLAAAAVGGPAHVPRHSRVGCRGGPCSGRTRVGATKQDRDAPRRPHPRRTRRCHRRGGPGTDSRAASTARLPGERRRRVVASALAYGSAAAHHAVKSDPEDDAFAFDLAGVSPRWPLLASRTRDPLRRVRPRRVRRYRRRCTSRARSHGGTTAR